MSRTTIRPCIAALGLITAISTSTFGQAVRPLPYSGQLRTDPAVGNVQGIQRYGRPLRTDPDQGVGFSYHVYPVADGLQGEGGDDSNTKAAALSIASGPKIRKLEDQAAAARIALDKLRNPTGPMDERMDAERKSKVVQAQTNSEIADLRLKLARVQAQMAIAPATRSEALLHPAPFDSTQGLRNYSTPLGAPESLKDPAVVSAMIRAKAFGYKDGETGLLDIYHQPLIQIKIRVVEVAREDKLQVNSILEYVSRANGVASLTSGNPLNTGGQNTRGITEFTVPGLISKSGMGSGALVNLTSEHINWAVSALAEEFNGDVVTAPQVVTLNGQNVEFISGQKVPFELGQNVIQDGNNNIQQFFFKNIGAYVSVTPKIVNWGFHGEGKGGAPVVASDVENWNLLIESMLDHANFDVQSIDSDLQNKMKRFVGNRRVVPFGVKEEVLKELSKYTKSQLAEKFAIKGEETLGVPEEIPPGIPESGLAKPAHAVPRLLGLDIAKIHSECQQCLEWKPENCTVDLATVVRLSDLGSQTISITTEDDIATKNINTESNVRAIANVIQVKSGHGVVMAGLIGEREEEVSQKVPFLGDIP